MEFSLKERVLIILKKVAIIALPVAMVATSITFMIKYNNEKETVIEMQRAKESVEIRLEQAEKKLEEQGEDIEQTIPEDGEVVEEVVEEVIDTTIGTMELLSKNLESLQNGDINTIGKWFGSGTEFTAERVKDATKSAKITVEENNDDAEKSLKIHVCNLDYRKINLKKVELNNQYQKKNSAMNEGDRLSLVDKAINELIESGEYDKHYILDVRSDNGVLEISEELKQAITGGWYWGTGEELQGYVCTYDNK